MSPRPHALAVCSSLLLLVAGAACTKPNPAVCCIDEADCAALDLPPSSRCDDGEACVDHQCELTGCEADRQCTAEATPYCDDRACVPCRVDEGGASLGCTPAQAVCDADDNACGPCATSDDCAAYADTPECGADGACVQCLSSAQCANPTPVCDATGTCTTCTSGDQCDSGVCDLETGSCAAPAQVVTVDVDGSGVLCTPDAPCALLATALALLDETRPYLHLRPTPAETPFEGPLELIADAGPALPRVQMYGAGATITNNVSIGAGDDYETSVLRVDGAEVVVWGLRLATASANTVVGGAHALRVGAGAHVTVHEGTITFTGTPGALLRANGVGVYDAGSRLTLDRTTVDGFADLLDVTASGFAAVDRSTLRSGGRGIVLTDLGQATITASVIALTTEPAITTDGGRFTLTGSTLVNTGYASTVARFLDCEDVYLGALSVHAGNVAWNTLGNVGRPMVGGTDAALCALPSSVLGPAGGPTPAGSNQVIGDPLLLDLGGGDYRLAPGSPAIDLYTGCDPADELVDFDGGPRPLGAGCDAGAFERQ